MPSCSQLALLGQSWPSDTLSDSGMGFIFLAPVLIGRTAFMPDQRFIVVTKAVGDLVGLREVCSVWGGEGNIAQPHPLAHTVPPASLLALPNTLVATAAWVCVCVSVRELCEWCINCCVMSGMTTYIFGGQWTGEWMCCVNVGCFCFFWQEGRLE